MTEENTKDLTDSEKLNLILADLSVIRAEFGERLTAIEREVKTIRRELGLLRDDIRKERLERVELDERVSSLEGKPV